MEFWERKISGNVKRDVENIRKLKENSWNVIVIWQCEIRNRTMSQQRLELLIKQIIN